MLIMNTVQKNILGDKLNFFSGKKNLGLLCPNGQVPSKVNVGPCTHMNLSVIFFLLDTTLKKYCQKYSFMSMN